MDFNTRERIIDFISFTGLQGCYMCDVLAFCRKELPSVSRQYGKNYIIRLIKEIPEIEVYKVQPKVNKTNQRHLRTTASSLSSPLSSSQSHLFTTASNCFIQESNVRGCCVHFKHRSLLDKSSLLTSSKHCNDYDSVVFVVVQQEREFTLMHRWTNKLCQLNAFTYCLLEYIAIAGFSGVMVVAGDQDKKHGQPSDTDTAVSEFPCLSKILSMNAKAIFYQLEPLEQLGLVTKHDCMSKSNNRSKLILHIKHDPCLKYFEKNEHPGLVSRHFGSILDIDLLYHVIKLIDSCPDLSIDDCVNQLNMSKRAVLRILLAPIERGDITRTTSNNNDSLKLSVSLLDILQHEIEARQEKRSLGRRKRNTAGREPMPTKADQKRTSLISHNEEHCFQTKVHTSKATSSLNGCSLLPDTSSPLRRPIVWMVLNEIYARHNHRISHSELSDTLRLDFYKARRIRKALSEMSDVDTQVDPDDAQEDHLYRIIKRNRCDSNSSLVFSNEEQHNDITVESTSKRSQRRKRDLLEMVKSKKVVFVHRLRLDLCALEHDAGITTAVDKKTIVNLLEQLANERHIRLVSSSSDVDGCQSLMAIAADVDVLPCERDLNISVRDADMVSGTLRPLRSWQRCHSKVAMTTDEQDNHILTTKLDNAQTVQDQQIDLGVNFPLLNEKCINGVYGYVAKFQRCAILHQFMFYLLYGENTSSGELTQTDVKPNSLDDHTTWYRHVPKIPKRKDMPSVLAVGDIILAMPLCIYMNLVQLSNYFPVLLEYVTDPARANLLVHCLPDELKQAILQKRKFLFQMESILKNLVMLGLVKFVENKSKSVEKQNMLIHVSRKVRFFYDAFKNPNRPNNESVNVSRSEGRAPITIPTKSTKTGDPMISDSLNTMCDSFSSKAVDFNLTDMASVENMWEFLMASSLTDDRFEPTLSRKRCRQKPATSSSMKPFYLEDFYTDAMIPVPCVPHEPLDIPGNRDGPLGVDKQMYSFLSSNWVIYGLTEPVCKKFRTQFPYLPGPPIPPLACRLSYNSCVRTKLILPWMVQGGEALKCDIGKGLSEKKTGIDIQGDVAYGKRFKTLERSDDVDGLNNRLDTFDEHSNVPIEESTLSAFTYDEQGSIVHSESTRDIQEDTYENVVDDAELQSRENTRLSEPNGWDISLMEKVGNQSEKQCRNDNRNQRKRCRIATPFSNEYKRVLNLLRASLMFLSVRLERFMKLKCDDRMSTSQLIEWLLECCVQMRDFDPRKIRPLSNIRKELNEDWTREAASALNLQMSLNNEMNTFKRSSKLNSLQGFRSAPSHTVETTLKDFYRKFRNEFNAYVINGVALTTNQIDLRKTDIRKCQVCRIM